MKSVTMILSVGFIIVVAFIITIYLLHRAYHGGANDFYGGLNDRTPGLTLPVKPG